jgi:hypothetical protein
LVAVSVILAMAVAKSKKHKHDMHTWCLKCLSHCLLCE